tara:strand:- start:701 stop:1030 length:330 start_codon:yes stop_codon:yes gene_type:complete
MEFKPYPHIVWQPTEELIANSQIQKFINAASVSDYDELLIKADADPEWFWNAAIKFLDIKFYQDYDRVMDQSKGIEWTEWCVGGKTNLVLNCLDKHKGSDIWHKPFIHH